MKGLAVITLPLPPPVSPSSKSKWMLKFMLTVIVHLPSCTLLLHEDCVDQGLGPWVAIATVRYTGPGISCWQHWTYHPLLMLAWRKALSKTLMAAKKAAELLSESVPLSLSRMCYWCSVYGALPIFGKEMEDLLVTPNGQGLPTFIWRKCFLNIKKYIKMISDSYHLLCLLK